MNDHARDNGPGSDSLPPDTGSRKGLTDTIVAFVTAQLGLHPDKVFIDEHGSSITVTLRNVLSDSEKNAAKDKRTAELIARALTEAFRSVSGILVANCSSALEMPVEAASFVLDPQSNHASIILSLDT